MQRILTNDMIYKEHHIRFSVTKNNLISADDRDTCGTRRTICYDTWKLWEKTDHNIHTGFNIVTMSFILKYA